MKIRTQILILILFLGLLQSGIHAQYGGFNKVGTTSFQFLKVVPNARVSAIGGASAATILSSEAVFFNPAGLTQASEIDMAVSYLDYFLDVNLSSFSMAYQIKGIGTIGIQTVINNIGEIEETTVAESYYDKEQDRFFPGLTGRVISPYSMVFGLSFARDITDKFTFGLTAKYVREDLVVANASAIVFDGGVLYKTGYKSLILGAMLQHFGKEIKYYEKDYPIPQALTIGISGYLLAPIGAFLMTTTDHKLLVAYDMVQTRDHSQQQHVGMEYVFSNLLALRCGYKLFYDEEGVTAGAGITVNRFGLDYAYNDFGEYLNAVHRFTLGWIIK